MIVITVRRFLCVACRAVVTVVPRGVSRRRHFGAGAIGLALFLFGLLEQTSAAVHRAVSDRPLVESRWRTLTRWIDAAVGGGLLGGSCLDHGDLDRRASAAATARSIQAAAPTSAGDELARMFAASTALA